MMTSQGYQAGTGSWTNALRNWLYFDTDAPYTSSAPQAGRATAREQQIEWQVAERTQELERVIAQLRTRQQQLEAEANHDALTGLANRKLLQDRFQCARQRARRSGDSFALLMIDLNGFKAINDTHGHAAGDKILVTMAHRLRAALRTCDTAARIGGDEFVALVESIHDAQEVSQIGHKLACTLAQDICLDGGAIAKVSASIGLALYPDDGLDMTHMLYVADQAMYECKASGYMSL